MRRRVLIPGPVLIGFAELFDTAYGDPKTPRPYPRVTPSRVGASLLPFPCPHCGEVRAEPVHPKKGEGYRDRERGYSWCPACRGRYVVNRSGGPLVGHLVPGATCAPALVSRNGKESVLELPAKRNGLDCLGAE